jgi:tRNA dimethylallyltransferase
VKVVFVVGATASGKSAYALEQAQKKSGAIINCDSIQVYQGLKIGSALPSPEEMNLAPHYLFSYVPMGEKITAGQYARNFFEQMEKIKDQYETVYVVGGTGFYFQAIEGGMYPVGAADPKVIAKLEEQVKTEAGAAKLYQELQMKDPAVAAKISPDDHYRLVRAVELMITHKKTLTEIKTEFEKQKQPFPWPLEKIGIQISKEDLLPRVKLRTEKMLKQGLVEEVQGLIAAGFGEWSALQSVGYKETLEFLNKAKDEKGNVKIPTLKILEEMIIQNTMQLAKKQKTWFKRDQGIRWVQRVSI